jgi:hypothetical protein
MRRAGPITLSIGGGASALWAIVIGIWAVIRTVIARRVDGKLISSGHWGASFEIVAGLHTS